MDWLREAVNLIFPFLESVPIPRAILGFTLLFFLPGFAWTLVFFRQINAVERVALSVRLSIAVVTLSILALSLVGVSITGLNSLLIIIVITIIPLGWYYLKRWTQSR